MLIGTYGADSSGPGTGAAYLFLSSSLDAKRTLALTESDYVIHGLAAGQFFSWSLAGAGDVDGGGQDDFLVGSYGRVDTPHKDAYLFLGENLGKERELSAADAEVTMAPESTGDGFGGSLSGAGDVDGDGLDDVLIGAYLNDTAGTNAGAVYLFTGATLGSAATLSFADADHTFLGAADNAQLGTVEPMGDVDGNGLSDLLMGSSYAEGPDELYVFLAASLGKDATIDAADADYIITGSDERNNNADFQGSLSATSDLDGDGLDDLLLGSSTSNASWVYLAASLTPGKNALEDADHTLLGISGIDFAADYSFVHTQADTMASRDAIAGGDFNGDGLSDLMLGASLIEGWKGVVYVLMTP